MLTDPLFRGYDVAPDGQSFAVMSLSPEALAAPAVIRVVQNWFDLLKRYAAHSGRAAVGLRQPVGVLENVPAPDLVID